MKSTQAVVVMLDALGFRGVWSREDPDKFADEWNAVVDGFRQLTELEKNELLEGVPEAEREKMMAKAADIKSAAFSDTIALCFPGDDVAGALVQAGTVVGVGFAHALTRGIFLRGAISIGKVYPKAHTIIGPAADDAAEWFGRADWIGVHLTPSAKYRLDAIATFPGHQEVLLKKMIYRETVVNLKRDSGGKVAPSTLVTYALNWPERFASWKRNDGIADGRGALLELFSRGPIGHDVREKYEHTLKFFDDNLPGQSQSLIAQSIQAARKATTEPSNG